MSNDELHVYWASPHIEWTETTVDNILKTHKSRRYEETNWKKRVAQTTSYVILPNLAHTLLVITVTFFLASIELFVSLSFRLSRVFRFRFSTIHVIALELKFLYFFYTCEKIKHSKSTFTKSNRRQRCQNETSGATARKKPHSRNKWPNQKHSSN